MDIIAGYLITHDQLKEMAVKLKVELPTHVGIVFSFNKYLEDISGIWTTTVSYPRDSGNAKVLIVTRALNQVVPINLETYPPLKPDLDDIKVAQWILKFKITGLDLEFVTVVDPFFHYNVGVESRRPPSECGDRDITSKD